MVARGGRSVPRLMAVVAHVLLAGVLVVRCDVSVEVVLRPVHLPAAFVWALEDGRPATGMDTIDRHDREC